MEAVVTADGDGTASFYISALLRWTYDDKSRWIVARLFTRMFAAFSAGVSSEVKHVTTGGIDLNEVIFASLRSLVFGSHFAAETSASACEAVAVAIG